MSIDESWHTGTGTREVAVRLAIAVVSFVVTATLWLALAAPTTYAATSSVYVKSGQQDAAATFQRGLYEQNRMQSYATLARSSVVCAAAARDTGLDVTPASLADKMSVQVLPQTVIIAITVEDTLAGHARDLSIAVAEEVAKQGNKLEQEGSQVSLLVFDKAATPTKPAAPNKPRILVLCAVLSILLCLLVPLPRRSRRRWAPSAPSANSATSTRPEAPRPW